MKDLRTDQRLTVLSPPSRKTSSKTGKSKNPRGPVACPLMVALGKLGSRWTLLVLRALSDRPRRFCEFRKLAPEVPSKSLARVLAKLEKDGLVHRKVTPTRPPQVTYALAAEDPLLTEVIETLFRWGSQQQRSESKARETG